MSDPIIHVYTVCWNEAQLLPFFLRHYEPFAERIVVFDNGSDDGTPDIVCGHPKSTLRSFDTGGMFREVANVEVKNTAYRESRGQADFVVVVDADEFLYHPHLMAILARYRDEGVTLPRVAGYDMVAWRFPRLGRPLTDVVRSGRSAEEYAKRCIFAPEIDINFGIGSHTCRPTGRVVESAARELCLLHYHYVGYSRCVRRHRAVLRRMPPETNGTRVNYQFRWGPLRLLGRFLKYRIKAHPVAAFTEPITLDRAAGRRRRSQRRSSAVPPEV